MRAIHKYKKTKHTSKEAQRRIAQSYGYQVSLYDSPIMMAMLQKAGLLAQAQDLNYDMDNAVIPDHTTVSL